MAEIIGGGSLREAIDKGEIPRPPLLGYQAWISWRARAGLRPTQKKSGHGTTSKQEAELWRGTMQGLYGNDWREHLDDEELRLAEEAEEAARLDQERRTKGAGALNPDELDSSKLILNH